jgi:hypothetical protein
VLALHRLRRRKLQLCRRPWTNTESNCFADSNPGRATAYTNTHAEPNRFANSNTSRSHANSDANCLANANSNASADRRQ